MMSADDVVAFRVGRLEEAHGETAKKVEEIQRQVVDLRISMARWAAIGAGGGAIVSHLLELLVGAVR